VQEKQLTDSIRVRAADYGEGRASVAIRDTAGQVLFGVEYTPEDDEHVLVTNRINLGALRRDDAGVVEDSYSIDWSDTDKFSLDDAVMGAAIIHGQYQNAARDDYVTTDTTGCSIPIVGTAASCSNKGACCDQHDKCYFEYHCDYLSWAAEGPATDACKKCNELVKTCVNPFNPGPGPAACCGSDLNKNTCGEENPMWDPATPIPKFPNGITDSGLDPKLSLPESPVRSVVRGDGDAGLGNATLDTGTTGNARDAGVGEQGQARDSGGERGCADDAATCTRPGGPASILPCKSALECQHAANDDLQDCDRGDTSCETAQDDADPSDPTEDEDDDSEVAADDDDTGSEDETDEDETYDDQTPDDQRDDYDATGDCGEDC
jgi:hypothetical protein